MSKLLLDNEDDAKWKHTSKCLSFEADAPPTFRVVPKQPVATPSSCDSLLTIEAIKNAIGGNDFEALDRMASSIVQEIEESPNALKDVTKQAAKNLLCELAKPKSSHPPASIDFALKWLPFLSSFGWDESLYEIFFCRSNADTILSGMITQCAECWNDEQVRACQVCILNRIQSDGGISHCSPQRLLDFLVHTSNQTLITRQPFAGTPLPSFAAVLSQAHAAAAVKLALECARIDNEEWMAAHTGSSSVQRCARRNMAPNWLVLLQLVARCSKKHLALVTNSLVSQLPADGWKRDVYSLVLFRLYVSLPSMMNLGDAKLRGILIEAAGDPTSDWLHWRCPLDDQVRQMVATLSSELEPKTFSVDD